MARAAADAGIERVHLIGWRDLDDPEAGGSEEHAVQTARHLRAAGLQVVHHTGAVPGGPVEIDRDGVRVVRRGGKLGVFATTIVDELSGRLGPCDALVDIWHGAPFFAPAWRRVPQAALVHHVHIGTWHHLVRPPLDRIGQFAEQRLSPVVYRKVPIITVAESTKLEIVEKLGFAPDQVTVARLGLDARFVPGGERSDRPSVVAVARMMPQKGLADLIPILAAVRERVPDLEAVVVGEGPQRPELEALRRSHDAEGWLTFAGRLGDDDVVAAYQRAWLTVSASRREGFGMTLSESAACGTPVVATRMSGHVDSVAHGRSGYLVDSPDEFADTVVRLLGDPVERGRLAAGARDFASGFTWESSTSTILDVLCGDARRRSARSRRGR